MAPFRRLADVSAMGMIPASELPKAIIVDMDGTLCDVRTVRHFVDRSRASSSRRNFDQFHSASAGCPSYPKVVGMVSRARELGFAVLVVTGRENKWAFLTSAWLQDHAVAYDELLMRSAKDYRPDEVVKQEILRQIVTSYRPLLAIDDREDIAEVWCGAGIRTALIDENGDLGRILPDSHDIEAGVGDILAAGATRDS